MKRRFFLLGASGVVGAASAGTLSLLAGCARRESGPPKPPESEPAAVAALERAIFAYAACKSYRDTGSAQFIASGGAHDRGMGRIEFRTLFRRPDKFRFECREIPEVKGRDDHYIVWQAADGARSWWGLNPKTQNFKTMLDALAGPSGVSYGAAGRVPSLLFPPESGAPPHLGLVGLRMAGGAVLNGERCEMVDGIDAGASRVAVWIDVKTRLIRKVVETALISAEEQQAAHEAEERAAGGRLAPHSHDFKDFRSETVTTYSPQIDAEIADADFDAGLPAGQ